MQRLLSEAEWEYCCRAGTRTRYWFGDVISEDQANFRTDKGTTEVGSYPANGFGLYDMHGNVWEWVEDVWHDNYAGAPTDGRAWTEHGRQGTHVVRGASWDDDDMLFLRSACRRSDDADLNIFDIGFRVARTSGSVVPHGASVGAASENRPTLPPVNSAATLIEEPDHVKPYGFVNDTQMQTAVAKSSATGQDVFDVDYYRRLEAVNFTLSHDGGQRTADLNLADIVLVGASLTAKTPISLYLANRGFKTANVSIVSNVQPPTELLAIRNPLVVGLIVSPQRIAEIRRNRHLGINYEDYVDTDMIKEEMTLTRKLCGRYHWPIIDVSRWSIEETAAKVIKLFEGRKANV